jgi:hypothetical protein
MARNRLQVNWEEKMWSERKWCMILDAVFNTRGHLYSSRRVIKVSGGQCWSHHNPQCSTKSNSIAVYKPQCTTSLGKCLVLAVILHTKKEHNQVSVIIGHLRCVPCQVTSQQPKGFWITLMTPHTCKLLMDISADQLTEPNQKELLLYN